MREFLLGLLRKVDTQRLYTAFPVLAEEVSLLNWLLTATHSFHTCS